jgi:hypothetical protein
MRSCASNDDCSDGQVCVDRTCRAADERTDGGRDVTFDAAGRTIMGIRIEPPATTIIAIDGAMPTVDLEVLAVFSDGSTAPLPGGFWESSAPVLGAVDRDTGVYTASGVIAGTTTVSVDAQSMTTTATVTVEIERNVIVGDAPADAPARFAAAPVVDPSRAPSVLYPLDATVFPGNVYPADVQWEGGAENDLYRVHLDMPGVRVRAFVRHSGAGFGYDWLVSREAWRALAETAPETPVTIGVDRWESATAAVIASTTRTVRFAAATIRGAIYYWDLGGGRILRIAGDGTGLESFMPSPPRRPSDGAQCVACHAISRDGRRMAAALWEAGDVGAIFDLTADTTADPPAMIVPPAAGMRFLSASFSPDSARLVANFGNALYLIDGSTGAYVTPSGAGLPVAGAAQPSWSPDGARIAYVSEHDGPWGVDFVQGNLSIIDVPSPDVLSAPRVILGGAPLAIARPSWSPDSQWIAFQHGQHSRAYQDLGGGAHALTSATIRMVSADGATVFELAQLNGGDPHTFYPTFSPFSEGGYFWLAFFSTRDYGNAQVGTRGAARRQLWVAAIDATPAAGTDPSASAYWLPQQDVHQENMAAFWAEEACRADGRGCTISGECCSGFCRDVGAGPVCVPPDIVECSHVGEACRTDADCCPGDGVTCVANRCSTLG